MNNPDRNIVQKMDKAEYYLSENQGIVVYETDPVSPAGGDV